MRAIESSQLLATVGCFDFCPNRCIFTQAKFRVEMDFKLVLEKATTLQNAFYSQVSISPRILG